MFKSYEITNVKAYVNHIIYKYIIYYYRQQKQNVL